MLSIIIPTYNEVHTIGHLLKYLWFDQRLMDAEVIVVDGGSTDGTCERVEEFPMVRLIRSSRKGRSFQLHLGAKLAKGDFLYFLHADCVPPEGFQNQLLSAFNQGKEAGCFRMCFDDANFVLGCYGWFTRFPQLIFRGGDQSLFITKSLYQRIRGFDTSLLIMEDYDIVKKVRKVKAFHVLKGCLLTSSRKFRTNGVVRLQLIFAMIHCMYFFGCSQEMLLRFYQARVR